MRAWEDFLTQQENELGLDTVAKWLRPLKVVRFDACNLYLESPDSFKLTWFEEHMRYKIQKHFFNNNHKPIKVHVTAQKKEIEKKDFHKKENKSGKAHGFLIRFDSLDFSFQFDNFIVSNGNILAFKLLREACLAREKQSLEAAPFYNPIYLHGTTGCGKSHLMVAAAQALQSRGKKALYVRAETFTEHVVNAIRSGEMQRFRNTYRNAEILLIDNIDTLSRKGATQEELFHTFNALHVEGKQIILGASRIPQELEHVESRLISRFEWGIVAPLHILEREKIEKLMIMRSEKMHFPLTPETMDFFLTTFGSNPKHLIRAFDALVLRSHLHPNGVETPLPLNKVRQTLNDLILEEEKTLLTPNKIIRTVAEFYGIKIEDILSGSQTRECVFPRQIAMLLCRSQLHLSYPKIGTIFSRDHSTVMTSVKQIQKELDQKNHEIIGSVSGIMKLLSR